MGQNSKSRKIKANHLVGPAIRRNSPSVHIVGSGLLLISPGLLVASIVEWISVDSNSALALLATTIVSLIIGYLLWQGTEIKGTPGLASIFSAVAWTWVACSVIGALPYILSNQIGGWRNWDLALFESISGFSCTGSTVLTDIEGLGRGLLLWRQLTQWYGGMGMVVLAVSILPYMGVGGLALMAAEAPGDTAERLVPRVRETAQRLWRVYLGITVLIVIVLFIIPGPGLYDSIAHALSTVSTGGFSIYNDSIGHYNSLAVELVIAFFLIVCSLSFNLHYQFLKGRFSTYFKNKDQSFFLKVTGVAIIAVALLNWNTALFETFWGSLRYAAFNVVTLISSGGFGNAQGAGSGGDFAFWAPSIQIILLVLMVMGGCVGSTSGGLKSYRVYIAGSHIKNNLKKTFRPDLVRPVWLGKVSVSEEIVRRVLGFITLFIVILLAGTLALASLGSNPIEAFSAALSAMSNMGPALGDAGPTSNFLVFSGPARGVLMALMLIGRLEIMAVLFMFISPLRFIRTLKSKVQKS